MSGRQNAPLVWCGARVLTLSIAAGVVTLVGCGETGPERLPLSGTVTLDGQPVDDATIVLTPREQGKAAAALIVDGAFTFTPESGPTPGTHDVRINPNEAEFEEVSADASEIADSSPSKGIPPAYQQNGTLTAEVSGDPAQTLSFELSSSG
jgi:predicted small lipoprotein YifL